MVLDIIIATYNRCQLLQRTILSLLDAPVPPGLQVSIIVADNNCKDSTKDMVQSLPAFGHQLEYVFEPRQGKSFALNTAIARSRGDLVGFIDDDEEIDAGWFGCVYRAFQDQKVDFIGGRTFPKWPCEPPRWYPPKYRAAVGEIAADAGAMVCAYSEEFNVMLAGGNAVIRRRVLEGFGSEPYNVAVGRKGKCLLTADQDMYHRLLAAGARGFYHPDLIVYHHVQPHMLTKHYFRRWLFWHAVSVGMAEKKQPSPVPRLFGIPRWYYRPAVKGLGARLTAVFPGQPSDLGFAGELEFIRLMGTLYGRFVFRNQDGSSF